MFLLSFIWVLTALELTAECQTLMAASKRPHVKKRWQDGFIFEPALDSKEIYYAEYIPSHSSSPGIAARVTFKPRIPTLLLNDFDDHFNHVDCGDSSITIYFASSNVFSAALKSWTVHDKFVLVTSPRECGNGDLHEPWLVRSLDFSLREWSISMAVNRTSLRSLSDSLDVDFGPHLQGDCELRRRQVHSADFAPRLPNYVRAAATSMAPTLTTDVALNNRAMNTRTIMPKATEISDNISFSYTNTTILPPDSSIAARLTGQIPIISGMGVKCITCTATGKLEMRTGGFTVSSIEAESVRNFFEQGYFEFEANGFSSTLAFEMSILAGFEFSKAPTFTLQLPPISLTPFEIPEVAGVGAFLDLTFPMGVQLNSVVNMFTGFKVDVPDGSKIMLDVGDLSSSTVKGFQNSKLTALPFNMNTGDLSLSFFAGFRPQVSVTLFVGPYDALDLQGGFGVFLDLPRLNATIAALDSVNKKCEPVPKGSKDAQDGLINFLPSVILDVGYDWDLQADIAGEDYGRQETSVIAQLDIALPTKCYGYDPKSTGLVNSEKSASARAVTLNLWLLLVAVIAATTPILG